MRALKDKKITLYQQVLEGNNRELFQPVHDGQLWAHVRDLSSEEIYNAYSTGTNEEARFIINWRPDVNASMCVVYKGKWYRVKRVDAYEGYKSDLRLYVESMNEPEADRILAYEGQV